MDSGGQRRPAKESHLSCCIVKPFSGFSHLPKVPPTLEARQPYAPGYTPNTLAKSVISARCRSALSASLVGPQSKST
jgi:hypothetical protein